MSVAALPVATSISGDVLIYLMFPLMVALIVGAITAVTHLLRRLSLLEQGLAIIVAQVSPPGSPALRDLVQLQAVEVAELRGLVNANLRPLERKDHPR